MAAAWCGECAPVCLLLERQGRNMRLNWGITGPTNWQDGSWLGLHDLEDGVHAGTDMDPQTSWSIEARQWSKAFLSTSFVSRSSVESFSRRVVGQHACGTRNLGGPIASKRRSWCRTRSRTSRNRSKTLTAPALRHDHWNYDCLAAKLSVSIFKLLSRMWRRNSRSAV